MKAYRTKRGETVFGEEKVLMEESILGYFENLYQGFWKEGDNNDKIYFGSVIALIVFAAVTVFNALYWGVRTTGAILILNIAGIWALIWFLQRLRGFSKEKRIFYDQINEVKAIEGTRWFTCPRFIIKYDSDDKKKSRYLVLPTLFMEGVEESFESIIDEFESRDITVNVKQLK